jgi:hypothetical protein
LAGSGQTPDTYLESSRTLIAEVFRNFDPEDVLPRHGPGATADRKIGRGKYDISHIPTKIDQCYPLREYFLGSDFAELPSEELQDNIPPGPLGPARVVLVPKDSRGPRIISCEPALMQYMQQGLAVKMVRRLEQHPVTRGKLNFSDQTINRSLALFGSRNREYCTIDLKDASDRVSKSLVEMLFPEFLLPYLMALRSESTLLPDGRLLEMKKYAPMGSALCFPVEALVFHSLACASIGLKTQRRARDVREVYTYGDDIIVPSEHFETVVTALEAFGLQVNRDKCYVRGYFRESCGCDAYKGADVTPVKIRVPYQRGRLTRQTCYRLSESARLLFDSGFWRASNFIWDTIESVVGNIPTTHPSFSGISRTSMVLKPVFFANNAKLRWHKHHQAWEARTTVLYKRTQFSPFRSAAQRLLQNLIQGCVEPYSSDVVVSGGTTLSKTTWARI